MKPKRHRRTKKEMEAFRASLTKEFIKEGRDIAKKKKVAHKSNLEVLDYVFDVKTEELEDAPKLVEGWVNVYKEGKTYWLGSDIHRTIEEARKVAGLGKHTQQIVIRFEEF